MPPIDDLPAALTTTTREKERQRWLRDYSFHKPDDVTAPGTEPDVQGSTVADMVMPMYHDIKVVADATDPTKISGQELTTRAEADGVFQLEAFGASGSVAVEAAAGGGHIEAGDVLTCKGLRYQCNQTGDYEDGDPVPVVGIDTGLATNLDPGTVMKWDAPRAGILTTCTVNEQSDGTGLSGGRPKETEDEYRDRWNREKRTRAASGNDAEIQERAEKTASVPVEKAFTIPCALGPSTTCIVFTLKPLRSGASRIPNSTQRDAVLANVKGAMPGDEGILMAVLVGQSTDIVVRLIWDDSAFGWKDLNPWPAYYAATGQALIVASATDAVTFNIATFNGDYSGVAAPAVGKNIAVYDQTNAAFRRKRILSFTGTGPWAVVCDLSNGVSDGSYVPVSGQRVMPWSDSLDNLVAPIKSYLGTFGPGEQFAAFFDPGTRQRRQPPSPREFPNVMTTKGLEGALTIPSLFDFNIAEPALPLSTQVGTPGVSSYLRELGYVAAFPL